MCLCGDSECGSCGVAQGTRTRKNARSGKQVKSEKVSKFTGLDRGDIEAIILFLQLCLKGEAVALVYRPETQGNPTADVARIVLKGKV